MTRSPNHDHSSIRRGPNGKIIAWTDITGMVHLPPVDVSRIGAETERLIRREDTVAMQVGARVVDQERFEQAVRDSEPVPTWKVVLGDVLTLGVLLLSLAGAFAAYAYAKKPVPIAPTADDFPPSRAITPTFDAYQFPPPPGPEERRLLGLEEK